MRTKTAFSFIAWLPWSVARQAARVLAVGAMLSAHTIPALACDDHGDPVESPDDVSTSTSAAVARPTVTMVGLGGIDPAWWIGMEVYLESVLLGIPVSSALLPSTEWPNAASEADVLESLRNELAPCDELALHVVVVRDGQPGGEKAPPWDEAITCRAFSRPMAWAPVEGDDTALAVSEQIWRGRAERHIVAQALRLLETPACVLPQCLMHPDESPLEMDLKARNMCPPCQEAFKRRWALP